MECKFSQPQMLVSEFYNEMIEGLRNYEYRDNMSVDDGEYDRVKEVLDKFEYLEPSRENALNLFDELPWVVMEVYNDRWLLIISHLNLFPETNEIPFYMAESFGYIYMRDFEFPRFFKFDLKYTPELYVKTCVHFNRIDARLHDMDNYIAFLDAQKLGDDELVERIKEAENKKRIVLKGKTRDDLMERYLKSQRK